MAERGLDLGKNLLIIMRLAIASICIHTRLSTLAPPRPSGYISHHTASRRITLMASQEKELIDHDSGSEGKMAGEDTKGRGGVVTEDGGHSAPAAVPAPAFRKPGGQT